MSDLVDSSGAGLGDSGNSGLVDSGNVIGNQADMANRQMALLPRGWFPDSPNVLTGVLTGAANALASIWSAINFLVLQTRLATATGDFLDLISEDYFGAGLPRLSNESDNSFRGRIKANLFLPRVTRAALTSVLQNLTGNTPQIDYAWHPGDVGAYGYGNLGYGGPGYYGSLQLNAQIFITIAAGNATPGQIMRAINATIPAGTVAWVNITGATGGGAFVLAHTPLGAIPP